MASAAAVALPALTDCFFWFGVGVGVCGQEENRAMVLEKYNQNHNTQTQRVTTSKHRTRHTHHTASHTCA
jgi:hypothetical protein